MIFYIGFDSMDKAIVVWSWFGWLSAAAYLAKAWYSVDVYEKNEQLWWRASVLEDSWFRRDMGPSWYLMPDVFEDFFNDFGKSVNDYISLTKLDPSYRIYFKDTPHTIDVYPDVERNRTVFEILEAWSTDTLHKFLERARYQYDVAMREFVPKNYDSVFDFFTWRMMTEGVKLNVFTTMDSYVRRYFSSPEMQKIIQYPLVFLGTAPKDAPALYNIMTYVDFGMGVWYPQGWIRAVIDAMIKLCKELGVTFHTHSEVKSIMVDDGMVQWIELHNGICAHAHIVISNADMHWTETHLLEKKYQTYPDTYRQKKVMAPSGFILYLGINKRLEWLLHHTLVFSNEWKKNFDQIFEDKMPPDDPSFYVCVPSKTDPSVAPEWYENLFILVPFPPGVVLTQGEQQLYRDKILLILETLINEPIRDHICVEHFFGARDFEERYHSFQWSALWLAHTLRQTALFRPNNYSKKVSWLYYVWGNTNPWIGMPMCLISWKLAVQRFCSIS
jgi:phytoene desaturase